MKPSTPAFYLDVVSKRYEGLREPARPFPDRWPRFSTLREMPASGPRIHVSKAQIHKDRRFLPSETPLFSVQCKSSWRGPLIDGRTNSSTLIEQTDRAMVMPSVCWDRNALKQLRYFIVELAGYKAASGRLQAPAGLDQVALCVCKVQLLLAYERPVLEADAVARHGTKRKSVSEFLLARKAP